MENERINEQIRMLMGKNNDLETSMAVESRNLKN